MKKTFLEFITDNGNDEIIKVLCRLRAKEAAKRGDEDKIKRLSSEYKRGNGDEKQIECEQIYQIMPPRRKWVHLGWHKRVRKSVCYQRLTSFEYNNKAIRLTIRRDRKTHPNSIYLIKLEGFIVDFLNWIVSDEFAIQNVKVIPIPKRYEKTIVECRPVTLFPDLKEALLLVLINRYLTYQFDGWLYKESLAFRAKRTYHGEKKSTSHHDAIERIREYRDRFAERNIFVAECDMQKFYDTVSHQSVRKAFNSLFKQLREKNRYKYVLEKKIVWAFLKCYTFPKNVLSLNKQESYWKERKIVKGEFKWVKSELIEKGLYQKNSISKARIGVPQGGALSGLIANAVLDAVDKRVENMLTEDDLYLRYCDDMILLSTDKKRCKLIFEEYQKGLKELRLIIHPPKETAYNRRDFWESKTKAPYLWTMGKMEMPEWIGFVGYEIRRDGCIRIRKKSLRKEIKKQRKYVTDLYEKLKGKKRVGNETIKASITNHLINMSVGRTTIWNSPWIDHELCWINGFRGLNDNRFSRRQVKLLDHCRNNTIHIAVKHFREQNLSVEQIEPYKSETKKKDERLCGAVRFYGKPYSYFYHFLRIAKEI